MKTIKISILSVLALFCASTALAEDKGGLFVEPGVTYEVGSADGNFPGNNKEDLDADGIGLAARVGFHVSEAFFLGIDGRFSKLTVKNESALLNYDATGNAYNWGPVVGFQMPDVGLRVWGNYILGSEIDPDSNNGFDFKFKDGTGYRVGAGFRVGVVSLNLEYQNLTYDEILLEQGLFAPGVSGADVENESWIASVSFPMEF